MEIAPNINATFTPIPSSNPLDLLDEKQRFHEGLYAYINADKDPELKKKADATFGRTVPFDNSETQATLIGRAFASRTSYRQNPLQYLRDNKLPVPPNWSGENYQLYTIIGQNLISKSQEHYNNAKAARDKALAEAQKDITELNNTLPSLIARSIRSAGGNPGTALTPEELQKLTKYGMREGAIQAQHRAATAWSYMSAWMNNIDSMQETGRDKLLDIANTLSDDKGKLDPLAMAAFVLMVDEKATELQSTDSQFWADFADKFQNFWRTTNDQAIKTGIGTAFAVSSLPELQPTWGQQYQAPEYYGDERVEKLYGYLNQAINTAISPSEKAEWHAKLLSEMGGLVGESIVPLAAGVAAGAALAPAGAFAAAAAGYGAGFAVSAPSAINNAIGNAYIKGVVNPELYGTLEGIGQAAAENIGGPATSLKLFTKTAGKLTNYAASRAAGSRFLANQYARTTLNYLTAGAFESVTELAEEELGGFIGSKLNAIARSMGFEVSPQAYQLGETLKGMKSHEVAAIFGYSYALGMFGIPANFRSARSFAKNTDNLLKAGHTAKTARDIQHQAFKTEDRIAEIQADTSLSAEQKAEAIRKEEQNFATYQKTKFTNDVLSDPQFRSRLEKEGANIRDEAEVALDVEHEADIQILKEHNILEAVVLPGEKYRMSFYEEGELQADGTRAPGKITTQEWTRMQLTNWLMLQKDTRIEQDLRSFQALLLAHAHAQSATVEETKAHFQNLGANRPLAALGELHKNGMTPGFFQKAAQQALDLQRQHQAEGMTPQEAAQQPSPDFEGLSLAEVQNLATGAAQRKEQEAATTGALQNISDTTNVEYGGLNMLASDGTALIKYVAGRASILDILEERFEADIKQRTRGNKNLYNQLAETLLHIQSHLPGNIQLLDPKKKGNYTKADFVEAYSKITLGAFLSNEKNLPINAAGHRLVQNIGRAVDTTRMFQTIGNAWLTYANSPEGKAHLEAGGQTIADIMQQAGFTFSNQLASARATAQQRTEVLEARNWQPAIEEELDALLEQAEEEQQLSDTNQQEAKEPITIPADQSITGQEITIEPEPRSFGEASLGVERPETGSDEAGTSPETTPGADLTGTKATTILSHMRDLIAKGKARAEHFAIVFREIPGLTEAQAIEQGIRPLTQKGNPTAAYTQGRLIAAKLTPQQFDDYINGKLKGKALKQALSEHGTSVPTNFSIKAVNTEAQTALTFESTPDAKAEKVKQDLERLKNTELHCINAPDIVATVKARQRGKLVSPAALNKSIANGFTMSQHLAAANKIDELYKFAIPLGEYDDMNHEANVKAIFRFACPVRVDSKIAFALLTLKRTEGDKLYSLELDEINQLGGTLDRLKHLLKEEPSTIPLRAADDVVARFLSKVKEYFGENALPPITAEQAESAELFTDGVLEAQNAIVTQPDVNFSIKAMHASPHNFRKFSTDKMGTGEGAQAYGWGLYFAEDEGVNKKYFNDFSIKRDTYLFDGKPMSRADIVSLFADTFEQIDKEYNAPKSAKDIAHTILWDLRDIQGGIKGAYSRQSALIEKRKKQQELNVFGVTNNLIKSSLAAHDVLKLLAEHDIQTHPATNYRVELNADGSNLLMWDEPISEELMQWIKKLADFEWDAPSTYRKKLSKESFDRLWNLHQEQGRTFTGQTLYGFLSEILRGDTEGDAKPKAKKAASELLAKKGYKGIKYLDGNSRSAGEGTYNYVIFSGDDIKITAVNETGVWSMDEGWEDYTDPTATFSIRAATPSTLDRFTADPLGERIVHTVRTEARRYARVLGDKTPQEQAMNAIASAESIIMAVDKYLHRPDKPVSRRHRDQLSKLRSIIEKYAQIIASGTPRSFKRISPNEAAELEAAIAELEAAELDTAETDPAALIEDDKRMNKRTREARSREHHRAIVREAAKGRVYKVLAAMLDTAADALDDYLKDQLLTKLHRLTATVAIKRTPSKRLKGKMTASMYRELEHAIELMAYSTRQKEDAIDTILTAHETLAQAITSNEDNLTRGNTLLIELAHQLEQEGTPVTAQNLTAALAAHEARVAIFADITSKNYEQTRTAANAIYHIIRYGRALWQQKHDAREENIQQYLQYFLAHTKAEQGTEQATRTASETEQKQSGLTRFANSMMNSMQLFHALSGIDALAPLMEHTQRSLATANVARDLHMKQMVTHVQAVYGRILGIKPATEAGYSDKQLKEISKKLDKFYAENNQRKDTGITRHYINADGKPQQEKLELTKWQALDLILTYRQQHYRPNAEHHGYTDKVLDALEKWCGTNLMELGEAMQKSIINDGTIAVYEEREGIPLRENPFYWPGHLNIAEQDAPDHPVISNPYHGASSYKFLKGRTNNLREASARNAYNVWKSAIAERANYVYLAPVTDTFNSLLARKEFAARLKTIIGPSLYHQLKETLREIDGTTWAETSLQEDPHNAVARALRNMAPALLAGNPATLIRQASAVANATLMPDFPPHEFAKQLVQIQQNQSGITIGRILRLPVFQARARDNSALNEMLALGTDAKYSSYANLARKAMGAIDYIDTFCNAIGATLYYNYKYEQYTRENNENGNILTDAEIHAKCENDIAIMLALTAQPLKRTDKSAFFWRNSKTVLGPLYLYMGSELINKVGMARANWIKRKAEGMGSLKNTSLWLYSLGAGVGAVAFLTELAVAYLTGNTPDDDDSLSAWLIATYINSAYGQYTSQMPVIGQITDLFTSPYSALFSTTSQIPGVKTIQSGKKIGKMLTDNKVYSVAEWQAEITRLARDLNGVAGYGGGINSHMPWLTVTSSILQSLTTAMNAAYFISTGARNDAFYADWLLPNWYKETSSRRSKRKGTSKPRRSKSQIEKWLTPKDK